MKICMTTNSTQDKNITSQDNGICSIKKSLEKSNDSILSFSAFDIVNGCK